MGTGLLLGAGFASVRGWQAILLCTTFYCMFFIIVIIFPSFSVLLNCIYLNQCVLTLFLIVSCIPLRETEQTSAWCLAACQVKHSRPLKTSRVESMTNISQVCRGLKETLGRVRHPRMDLYIPAGLIPHKVLLLSYKIIKVFRNTILQPLILS